MKGGVGNATLDFLFQSETRIQVLVAKYNTSTRSDEFVKSIRKYHLRCE